MFRTPLRIDLPRFQRQQLEVTAPLLKRPVLLLNGQRVPLKWGKAQVIDDQNQTVAVKIRRRLPDPMPTLAVGDVQVLFGEPWRWYERLWMGLPAILLTGGLSGIILAMITLIVNGRIFRSRFSPVVRYLGTLFVLLLACAAFGDLWWLAKHAHHLPTTTPHH